MVHSDGHGLNLLQKRSSTEELTIETKRDFWQKHRNLRPTLQILKTIWTYPCTSSHHLRSCWRAQHIRSEEWRKMTGFSHFKQHHLIRRINFQSRWHTSSTATGREIAKRDIRTDAKMLRLKRKPWRPKKTLMASNFTGKLYEKNHAQCLVEGWPHSNVHL